MFTDTAAPSFKTQIVMRHFSETRFNLVGDELTLNVNNGTWPDFVGYAQVPEDLTSSLKTLGFISETSAVDFHGGRRLLLA